MVKKISLSLMVLLVAFTVALPAPASATEDTETTEETTTVTEVTKKAKLTFQEMLAHARTLLAAKKKGATTAETKIRDFGSALKNASSSCIMELVDDREVAIQEAWATFNTSIGEALKARQSALYSAWGEEDTTERASGIKEAMKAWLSAHKTAFKTLRDARKSAWATYKSDARSECSVTVPAEDKLSSDSAGSVSL